MLQCHTFLTSYCYRVIRVKGDSIPSTACSVVLTTIMLLRVGVIADPLNETSESNHSFSTSAANGVNITTGGINSTLDVNKTEFSSPFQSHCDPLNVTNECNHPFSKPATEGGNSTTGGINSTIDANKTKFSSPFKSHFDYDDTGNCAPLPVARTLTREGSELKEKAHAAINTALDIMFSKEGWTSEIIDGLYLEDLVESKKANEINIFRTQIMLNTSMDKLMTLLFDAFESEPRWNPTVLQCDIVQKIDNSTQLVYIVSAPACDGMISMRDYVVVRERAAMENSYVISAVSVETFTYPENKRFIRGEVGPSCYLLTPVPDQTNLCELRWLLNTNLNGWLSQEEFHEGMKDTIKKYLKHLRKLVFDPLKLDFMTRLQNPPNLRDFSIK